MEAARPAVAADRSRLIELAQMERTQVGPRRGGDLWNRRESLRPVPDGVDTALLEGVVIAGTILNYVVGFGVGRVDQLDDGSRLGVVDDFFVEEPARAVGVGEAMMNDLVAWFRGEGCFGIDALALPGDRAAKNFFESFGLKARLLTVHTPLV
ncbi:MAG: GNAT family N-acetyltransferase [Actinomycetia bacterium]|nr:GNAT family N-acetyltransferase [Actinomycetes bacterium]MCP3909412.1 GNAT family N-acetyltransferase [Actinomycetes bacterium]MCP4083759.1 GNAT family N-acetyltransferase [Actinomycetes bacterium]